MNIKNVNLAESSKIDQNSGQKWFCIWRPKMSLIELLNLTKVLLVCPEIRYVLGYVDRSTLQLPGKEMRTQRWLTNFRLFLNIPSDNYCSFYSFVVTDTNYSEWWRHSTLLWFSLYFSYLMQFSLKGNVYPSWSNW